MVVTVSSLTRELKNVSRRSIDTCLRTHGPEPDGRIGQSRFWLPERHDDLVEVIRQHVRVPLRDLEAVAS